MKKSYYLVTAAVLAAAAVTVYAQLPSADPPDLPPVVPDPNAPVPKPAPPPVANTPGVIPAAAPPQLPSVPAPTIPAPPPVAQAPAAPKLPTVPPPGAAPVVSRPATAAPAGPRFVVTRDEKLHEGAVRVEGEKVFVKHGALDRPFPKADVLFVGSTKDEVYRFAVGRVPGNDPAARLRVAKWCMFNGMRTHALLEAREVLRLDPKNPAAAQMARVLEESLQKFPEDGAPAVAAVPTTPVANPGGPALPTVPPPAAPTPRAIPPAIPPENAQPQAAAEPEVSPELAAAFPTRVQPVLVNQCADCHAKPGHASSFRLAPGTDFDANPLVAKQNIAAVAKQLNKADPARSPLLAKALAAHGGLRQPPFSGRAAPGYRVLEAWAYAASGSNAVPPPVVTEPVAGRPAPTPGADATGGRPVTEAKTPTLPPALPVPVASAPTLPMTPVSAPAAPPVAYAPGSVGGGAFGQEAKPLPVGTNPTNPGEPADEFDPSVFNRTMHPGRR